MRPNTSSKKKLPIILICFILAAGIAAAAVIIFSNSGVKLVKTAGYSPEYAIPAMPAELRKAVSESELARLAALEDSSPAASSVRNLYEIKLAVNEFTDDYSYAMAALHETVSFRNTTGQSLGRISLRDYAQAWIEEARHDIPFDGQNPFDADTQIMNVTDAATGAPLTAERDADDPSVIYIALDRELADGEQMSVSFDFTLPVTQTGLRGSIAEVGKNKYAMDLCNFYPVLSEWKNGGWVNNPDFSVGECFYTVCSDYDVTVSVPEGWSVIATGDEKETETYGGYSVWHCSAYNVRDFALTVSNGHDFVEAETETGVRTRFWYYKDGVLPEVNYEQAKIPSDFEFGRPANYEKTAAAALRAAVLALELFEEKIGEYPYDSMDVVETGMGRDGYCLAGGMEYPQYVIVDESLLCDIYDTDSLNSDELYTVIAHEIGHNWFYGAVGNDEYNDTWLDEGLTTVLENLFAEEVGKNDLPPANGKNRTKETGNKYKLPVDMSADNYDDDEYSCVVYSRAAYFLFEVRDAIGEEAFLDMLSEYYDTYKFREVTTEEFIAFARKFIGSNPDAQKLFKKYLSKY